MLHNRIKETRTDRDLGQKEIAAALGITQQQYSLYETGRRKLPADLLAPLCRALGVSAKFAVAGFA